MERIIYVPGKQVSLVIPESKDLDIMWGAINNVHLTRFLGPVKHYTRESEELFLKSVLEGDKKFFIIMKNENKETIGGIGFNEYNIENRNGVIGIYLYNEKFLGKGYGTEAMQLFLKYAFEYIGCHKVKLNVFANNPRAIKSYEKSGFKIVGTFKEDSYIMGEYIDSIAMELLKSDYISK